MNPAKLLIAKVCTHIFEFIIVLIGITFLTFSIMYISPKNPAELWLIGSDGNVGIISQEAIIEQEIIMGLDKPFIIQYGNWLIKAIQGDLGISLTTKKPVIDELKNHMMPTIIMTFVTLAITVVLSIPLGILCAVYKDGFFDNIMRIFSFIGISIPSFVSSLLFLWFFCIKLKLMPVIAQEGIKGLVLPIAVLVVQCSSKMIRQVRAIVLEELGQPYVDGGIIRGVNYRTLLFSHVLKNSAVPILTCISVYVGILLGGSTVIENIFSIKGLGKLAVNSVDRLDYYMIQGLVLWCTLVYLLVNLAVDVLAVVIDPRVKYNNN